MEVIRMSWQAVLAALCALALIAFADPASAQSVECRRWVTYGTPALDFHGTPVAACTAFVSLQASSGGLPPYVQTSCTPGSGEVVVGYNYDGPTPQSATATIFDAGPGVCSSDPPDDPGSAPANVPIDFTNSSHLMQAMLVACCAIVLMMGIGAGGRQ